MYICHQFDEPTSRKKPETPNRLMGAGDLDLSVHFLFTFGDVVAGRIPAAGKTWKFGARRGVGIYPGDAEDTKRGYLVYMLATGVRFDCIRLEVKDEKLLSAIHSRTRLQERTSPIQKVRDTNIDFEELVEDTVNNALDCA